MFASSQNRWWIVIASMLGLTVSYGAISLFTFAVFLKPVSTDLAISRGLMTSGLLVASLVCGLTTPLMGMLIDRWGSRRVLLLGIPLFALATAALSLLQRSPVSIYALFACTGFFGAAQNTVPYAKVISSWFDRERGVALGIAMTGMGISVAIVPQIAALMIEAANWRMAYISVGTTIILLALIPVLLFVREPAPDEMRQRDVRSSMMLPGLAVEEAVRTWRFWAISVGFFVAVVSTHGALLHVVALMTDRGASTALATAALSTTGIGMIAGRLVCGWALDRFHGPNVAICFLLVPAIGIGCLISGRGQAVAVVGSLLCGIGLGAHVGLMAYFAGRYFGLRAYGKIYGLMFGLFLIGGGVGPYLSGLTFDLLHSYEPALLAFIAALLVVSLLFAPLGAYPFAASSGPATISPCPVASHARQEGEAALGAGRQPLDVFPARQTSSV